MTKTRERRPHYECDHSSTTCRDCDGSPAATDPWRTFTSPAPKPAQTHHLDDSPIEGVVAE